MGFYHAIGVFFKYNFKITPSQSATLGDLSDPRKAQTICPPSPNRCGFPQNSIFQSIIADCNPGADFDIDSFIRAACVQFRHLTGDGRTADAQFPRHLLPWRTDQPRLWIDPLPKVLHYPLSEVKRNLRRTPPWIPCRSMCFTHTNPFLCLYWPLPNRSKTLSFRFQGPPETLLGLKIPPSRSHKSLSKVS